MTDTTDADPLDDPLADPLADLRLPPAFAHRPGGPGDLLEQAVALAPRDGAGTFLTQIRDQGAARVLSMAVVLEPEEPLSRARLAFLLAMVALADAMAAHCPPERPVRLTWPDEIRFDKARIGGARLAVAPGTDEGAVPDWIVVCADLVLDRPGLAEPGRHPDSTSLVEEGFDPPARLVETFASYLMLYVDRWLHDGPDSVTNRYLMRIDPPLLKGVRRIEGDRLVEITPSGGRRFPPLPEALGSTGWRDSEGPRL
jgi:hypothetical protein